MTDLAENVISVNRNLQDEIDVLETRLEDESLFVSVCCGETNPHSDFDICPGCGEHTEFEHPLKEELQKEIDSLYDLKSETRICERCSGGGEVMGHVHSAMIEEPWITCKQCGGSGLDQQI